MITIFECAVLSEHTYQITKTRVGGIVIHHLNAFSIKSGRSLLGLSGWYRINDHSLKSQLPNKTGFSAQLYIKFQQNTPRSAIVAYRGTSNWENDKVDIEAWYKSVLDGANAVDNIPENYLALASQFYRNALDYLAEYFPTLHRGMVNVTGHSLGGALAQLIPAACCFPARAITFNAPGIATMPGVSHDMSGRIYAVEAKYDFISKIGQPLGHCYYVDVPNEESIAKAAFRDHADAIEHRHEAEQFRLTSPLELITANRLDELSFAECMASAQAQHKMTHLVQALQQPVNQKIANKVIV